MKRCFTGRLGFTLIELLVVVLIIGILAAVAVPQYQKAIRKSRLAEVGIIFNTVSKGIDKWILENGFPANRYSFSGMNRDAELDISPTWAEESETMSYNKTTGSWHFVCDKTTCYISFYGKKWLNNNLYWMRGSNSNWRLYSLETEAPSTPEVCRWWHNYGTGRMSPGMVTVCAPYL